MSTAGIAYATQPTLVETLSVVFDERLQLWTISRARTYSAREPWLSSKHSVHRDRVGDREERDLRYCRWTPRMAKREKIVETERPHWKEPLYSHEFMHTPTSATATT